MIMEMSVNSKNRMEGKTARQPYRLFKHEKPAMALGLAVNHLMSKPAFARLAFGEWSRILVGQINRGHYYFVVDDKNQIQGFAGWGLTSRDKAEAWLNGSRPLSYEDCLEGDHCVCNVWSANTNQVHRWMTREARRIWTEGKLKTIYFKRYYADGRVRATCFSVNQLGAEAK